MCTQKVQVEGEEEQHCLNILLCNALSTYLLTVGIYSFSKGNISY